MKLSTRGLPHVAMSPTTESSSRLRCEDSCDTITYTAESDVSVISFYAPWTEFGRRSQDAPVLFRARAAGVGRDITYK